MPLQLMNSGWPSPAISAPDFLLFGHAVDVVVAVTHRVDGGVIARFIDGRFVRLNADVERRETGHYYLVSRHADDTAGVRRAQFGAGIVHRVGDRAEEIALGPEIFTTPIPPAPVGVAVAAMVSASKNHIFDLSAQELERPVSRVQGRPILLEIANYLCFLWG